MNKAHSLHIARAHAMDFQIIKESRARHPGRWHASGPLTPAPLQHVMLHEGRLVALGALMESAHGAWRLESWAVRSTLSCAKRQRAHFLLALGPAQALGATTLCERLPCPDMLPPADFIPHLLAGSLHDPMLSWRARAGAHLEPLADHQLKLTWRLPR